MAEVFRLIHKNLYFFTRPLVKIFGKTKGWDVNNKKMGCIQPEEKVKDFQVLASQPTYFPILINKASTGYPLIM